MTLDEAIQAHRDAVDAYARERTDARLADVYGALRAMARAHDPVLVRSLERRERVRLAAERRKA